MPRKLLVALVLAAAALAVAALAGVEHMAGRHPNVYVPQHAASISEPSAVEAGNVEPSASPVLTR